MILEPIPSAPGYFAGSDGHVWRNGSRRKAKSNGHGYLAIKLSVKNKQRDAYVHRLVCEAFHGPPPEGFDCAHRDGTRDNNVPENLYWADKQTNERDKLRHGTRLRGDAHPSSVLTEAVIIEARDRARKGEKAKDIAADLGVNAGSLWSAITGEKWRHLPGALRSGDLRRKFTDDQVLEILKRAKTETRISIADRFGVTRNSIDQIVNGKTYIHVPRSP